jgi:hypothetical protein
LELVDIKEILENEAAEEYEEESELELDSNYETESTNRD